MEPLRIYLLAGLLVHKAVWEVMKRNTTKTKNPPNLKSKLVKAVKIGILLGIVVQTLVEDVLPIAQDPASLRILGALIYSAGLAVALLGRIQLGQNWTDIESAGVKQRHGLVSKGIYRLIRHPIYAGDLLLLLGLELALNSWLVVLVILLAPAVLRQAVREERMLQEILPGYRLYCERTKRFIPFLA